MKILNGIVTGLPDSATAKVNVEHQWQHPLYKKSVTRSKTYACAYDEKQKLSVGDLVVIQETKPLSKTKHFRVVSKQDEI